MAEMERPTTDRRSAPAVVASKVRAGVLAGEYPPGTPIRESVLARELMVSRATMREALQQLAGEGLVIQYLNRGTVVTDLAAADIHDIYAVRLVLEVAAVDAAEKGPFDLTSLAEVVKANSSAARRWDVSAFVDTDMHLHREIVRIMGSPRISSWHGEALGQLRIALNLLDRSQGDLRAQAQDHSAIVRHLERREFVEAKTLLRSHLERARDNLLEFLATSRTPVGGSAHSARRA
jgi:DNA-binding GntR family transcriptional regulator